ncbi:MAG: chemotaxis response regulator protein-glutamate methylesterase [Sphingomonas bacterium]|uniref:chemotaxis-specific protein-glutamate methyltransferase CheB n=1 Tax=Sphingomonas bacterium TaxID=1895847 RepID=UPI00262E8B6E|nr:chemotaxis-specific protein-glutamate methyltransferase CheB [Sphingomonas bacterium]MDB5694747.1 chemotaxis response regulator protein-glutamate methylesterase [Sphingomonas bacterium]
MRAATLRAPVPDQRARVLIVDDSAVARAVIGRVIGGSDGLMVAGEVQDVRTALEFLAREQVDFILLDINLPGVDGVTALPDLIVAGGAAKVLIVSSSAADGAQQTIQALAFGAADTLVKPTAGAFSANFAQALLDKLRRLGEPAGFVAPAPPVPPRAPTPRADAYDLVAIGASTGGIHALSHLLRELRPGFRLPILITQHLPATFMPYFAAQLATLSGRPCDVATDRMRVRPGRLIVAPGDAHLCVAALPDGSACIRLSHAPSQSGCMPSVDPMLASAAAAFGARAIGVVLSGMGRDGTDGARTLRAAGGAVVVQDQESSVVWGMPGAVAAAGLADIMLPPDAIGRLLAERRRP